MAKVRKRLTRKDKIEQAAEAARVAKAQAKADASDRQKRIAEMRAEAEAFQRQVDQATADRKAVTEAQWAEDRDGGDLFDLLSGAATADRRCCSSADYGEWEKLVAEPELRAAGYIPFRWRSTDRDSFGPLVRAVDLVKDGVRRTYTYG